VGTWLRDGGVDPRSADGARRSEEWLEHFARADVQGIGFGYGYVSLRRTDRPSDVLAEDLQHTYTDPLGPEVLAYLQRVAWLRTHELLDARFTVVPSTALQRMSVPGEHGWRQVSTRLHRGDGPAWQHEVDELGAALLAGMRPDGLALGELVAMLELANDEPAGSLRAGARAIFQFLWVWNDLLVALVFSDSTQPLTVAQSSQTRAFGASIDILAPGAFLSLIVPLIVFFAFQRYFVQGVMAGSVK